MLCFGNNVLAVIRAKAQHVYRYATHQIKTARQGQAAGYFLAVFFAQALFSQTFRIGNSFHLLFNLQGFAGLARRGKSCFDYGFIFALLIRYVAGRKYIAQFTAEAVTQHCRQVNHLGSGCVNCAGFNDGYQRIGSFVFFLVKNYQLAAADFKRQSVVAAKRQ